MTADQVTALHDQLGVLRKRWDVMPNIAVAVDQPGCIVLDIANGLACVTVPDIDELTDALARARHWRDVTMPSPGAGRHDRNPQDRSLAFTALLEFCPGFGQTESRQGKQVVTDFLADFEGQPEVTNMCDFARTWRP
jgi:hypothetical protein